jgi:hypothetical protein
MVRINKKGVVYLFRTQNKPFQAQTNWVQGDG